MKKLNNNDLKKVDGGATRPVSRKKKVTSNSKGVSKRGSGLGTKSVGRR